MGAIKGKLDLYRLDKNYRLLEHREQPMRSWTLNLFKLLYSQFQFANAGSIISVTDYNGWARNVSFNNNLWLGHLAVASPGGGSYMCLPVYYQGNESVEFAIGERVGIVVGTDGTAPAPTNYQLGARITHGNGAGYQLYYGGTEVYGLTYAHPNASFNIRRYLTNASGGSINIQEVGIHASGVVNTSEGRMFLIARDVVSPAVAVADGEILSVVYTVQITV